ncbi:MAG: hypothetical protein CL843_19470 [Crocinitomicaceae bacterium]|nr:hypothetical protein [Crocinitomicaceae bacterium]
MHTHAEPTPENKSQATSTIAQTKSHTTTGQQFKDQRKETVQLQQLQNIANRHAAKQHKPIQRKPNKTGLPHNLKTGMENLSGISLDHVRVHYNSPRPAQMQAHAYAQGSEIHLASGQEKHLPHELGHVVQQAQGRVAPTTKVNGLPVNDHPNLEKEADAMGNKALQLKSKFPSSDYHQPAKQNGKVIQPKKSVIQLRTSYEQQMQARTDANYIVDNTTADRMVTLQDRMTFNADPGGDAAIFANLQAYRANALQILHDFGNVLDIAHHNGFTNYFSNGLDGEIAGLANHAERLRELRDRNNNTMVAARKLAMFDAVASRVIRQRAYDYNGQAFRNATTFAVANHALQEWENRYFSISRAQIIEAAKRRAINGHQGNATIWQGLSAPINRINTHMTIYNADIPFFHQYLVTRHTDRVNSNTLANDVLANGVGQRGIHLTAEINPAGNANPRVFGNPPNPARHSNYNLPNGMAWNNFAAPLTTAQNHVRDDVWNFVRNRVIDRG